MRLRPLLFLPVLGLLLTAAHAARAQVDTREGIALQNQILELRHELQIVQSQVAGGGVPAPVARSAPPVSGGASEITAELLSRVAALEEQVRELRGRIDEIANRQQTQGADLAKQIGDLGFRVQMLEGGGRPGAGPAMSPQLNAPQLNAPQPGPPSGSLGTVPMPPLAAAGPPGAPATPVTMRRTPELAIQEGNAALARRDYATAEAAARDVLTNNRTSPRAYDAQYLLAETLSGKRDYSQAAIAYDDAYRRSPTGVHSQDSLLGLADSLTAINEKRAACDTLAQLRAQFPTPRPDLVAPLASARQRAGCK
jgi:TolA-binding protein